MQPMPLDPAGRLFASSLDQIDELYVVPVSNRALALDGAARLSRLDPKLQVTEVPGPHDDTEIVLTDGEREIAAYPSPAEDDPHLWGAILGRLETDAKRASPVLAAHPQDEIDKALFDGITSGLDRFSRYNTPEVARDQRAARDGFGGIGILLEDDANPYRITKVIPGSSAAAAGIRVGDQLVAVDGEPTAGRSQNEVIRQLRGAVSSTVAVTIGHPGQPGDHSYQLQRTLIVLPTVTMTRSDGVAVFHISGFNQNTTQQLVADLDAIKRETDPPLRGIVLDLRGDPGGLLDQAVSLADVFIAKGAIVATVGRNPASRQYFAASGDAIAPRVPIVVLINGGSASASEILAAALQDSGRAVVVGTASYGKGTVQTVLRLPNDGELVLTWAELVAPAGYSLNGHGVVPTICTSDLGNDPQSIATALQRATEVASMDYPRASLDERGWIALRRSCPPRRGDRTIDAAVAARLLTDPVLYSQAVHMIEPAPNLAAKPVGIVPASSERALTGVDGTLSSSEHYP
ncbi:MAG TPA: S41 family peptidase [Stellaceae bacterium]|nr:S41 family peptidase [Stellaceae bacterium]